MDGTPERSRAGEGLDRFFMLSLDLLCVAGVDGYFVRVNPSFERVLGYSREELLARPFLDFVHPEDRAATVAAVSQVGGGAELIAFENRYVCRDGSYRWLQWTAVPAPEEGAIYASARDVTDTKRAQRELRRYANEMEQAHREQEEHAERLAQLVTELERSRRLAEAGTRAKGEFLANMSHEIRTPMNAIIGMTDLALGTELTPVQQEYLRTVKESSEALLELVDDILDFSKIEAGKVSLDRVRFDVRDTVENAVRLLAPRAHGKGLELVCHILPEVPSVLIGDPGRLRQVLVNLVGNAVKFTEHGEVIVTVAVDHAVGDEVLLKFIVADTGIGIPSDQLWKIFGPFVQADPSTTRRYGGTGLGLTISTQLVELMGGRVWAESEPGKGSQFHFVGRFGVELEAAPARATDASAVAGARVLVVDDNPTNRRILEEMLATWGMRPVCEDRVEGALAALDAAIQAGDPFRLVVTDALMPDVDGFTLIGAMTADQRLRDVPIIMLTSAGRALSVPDGVSACLTKPVKHSEMLDAILTASGSPPAAAHAPPLPSAVAHTPRRHLRVLVAEDNATNQRLVVALLTQWGHAVTVVGDGREAVRLSGEAPFDIVLMDVQMPEMNGLDATAAIRAREPAGARRIPIVAMTAHAMASDRDQCLAAGMDGYISKPVRAGDLFAAIETVAGAPEVEAASPSVTTPATADVIDIERLIADFGGSRELVAEVIGVFLADSESLVAATRRAAEQGDAAGLASAAHALKGSVGLFSRGRSFEAARRLELKARDGDLSHALDEIADLETAVADLVRELRALVDGLGSDRPSDAISTPARNVHDI